MAKPERPDDDGSLPDWPDDDVESDRSGDGTHWYSWSRWKYIGGGLFLTLSVIGVGYVIWDIIDLLPKPVTIGMVRAALRESPGRITDMVAMAGLISFGPPAGVDLMFGATEAAKQWARKQQRKDLTKGRIEGRKEGRIEGREEGRIEGRVEGHEEGRIEGRVEGRVEGQVQERDRIMQLLKSRAADNPDDQRYQELLDEIADDE